MTNSKTVTPFCCDMSDASEQEIRDLHKMCLDAGANIYDEEEGWVNCVGVYNYMGVDEGSDVTSLGYLDSIFNNNLITLSQVPEHLGLASPEDNLVEGAIQEAYIELRGYLGNVVSASNGYRVGTGILFKSPCKDLTRGLTSQEEDIICTVKEFQEYCEQQSHVSTQTSVTPPVTGFTTEPSESHTDGVKPPVWTTECLSQGISFQDGMLVNVNVKEHGFKGKGIVMCHTEKMVIVEIDGVEEAVHIDCISPYEEEVVSQRDKVMGYLEQEFDEEDSNTIYNEILKLGVFKEDE